MMDRYFASFVKMMRNLIMLSAASILAACAATTIHGDDIISHYPLSA